MHAINSDLKTGGEMTLDVFDFFLANPVRDLIQVGNDSFSGQMYENSANDFVGSAKRYGASIVGLVGGRMGARVPVSLADNAARSTDNVVGDLDEFTDVGESMIRFGAPCHSFSADTMILTENGYVPISELQIGDVVYAYNEATDRMDYYPVTATWEHLDPVIVHVTIDGEVIETPPGHLFYTAEGWVEAGNLWLDAEVFTADSDYGRVQNLTIINEPQWMYDITVDVAHTFFVGKREWLVHNCGDGWTFASYKSTKKWQSQMTQRGWTNNQITEALQANESFPATNSVNKNNTATRYVHPITGRSVVIDDVTKEVIHLGGDGFLYGP